jgi:sigma-B regulation protein RsbU (phosphoserine phosphatase)
MFVTVWLGIMEISTGKVTAANAGHEYPMIKRAGGQFELFKDKHGFVIGGMKGMRYKDYEFTLGKGDTLFIYTDGVPEATNADNELFGKERMIAVLNKNAQASPKELLTNIKKSVDDFVGEAPQFDDLTMLGLKIT